MLNGKYLTIYDFRILPISLGDVLQWLALKKLEATLLGFVNVDLVVVYPKNFRGNLINEIKPLGYWDSHFQEMIRVFESTDFIENLIITNSGIDVDFTKYINGPQVFEENQALVKNIQHSQSRVWEYIRAHQSFEPFNTHYDLTNKRIIIESKREIIDETTLILDKLGLKADNLVVCQPRFRMIDNGLPFSDPYRDSIYIDWANFFAKVDCECILIGRCNSIPVAFKNFKNVFFAREVGLDIRHELVLLRGCKFFLGASSGFAIAAHFSNVRYKIFGVKGAGFQNYGVSVNSEKLLFASSFQNITKNEINLNALTELNFLSSNLRSGKLSNITDNLFYLMCFDFVKMRNQIKIDDLIANYRRFHQFNIGKLFIYLYVHVFLPIKIFYLNLINYKNVVHKQLYFGTLGDFVILKLRKKMIKLFYS